MSDPVNPAIPQFQWLGVNDTDNVWQKLSALYVDVLQRSWQEWINSATQIVQQQATRAVIDTSQALFENAAQIQQKTWGQMLNTNQQAAAIVAGGVAHAATESFAKATEQVVEAAGKAVNQATTAVNAAAGTTRK